MEVAACIRFSLGLASTLQQPGTILQQVNEHQAMGWSTDLFIFEKKWGKTKQTTKPSKQDTNCAVLNMLRTIKAQFSEGQTTNLLTTRMSLCHVNLWCNSDRLSWGSCMACPGLVQELWSSLPCIAHGQLLPWPCALHCVNSSFYTDVLLYYIGYQGRLRNAGYLFHPALFLFHIYAA